MYAISARVEITREGWVSTREVPTFYLDESVQGITSEAHAASIARDVVTGSGALDVLEQDVTVHVSAVRL